METERIQLIFKEEAVLEIARVAAQVNNRTENIGARRLHTILEKLLDEISFNAPELQEKTVEIDADYVRSRLEDISTNEDLANYIL
jgi:ATP-dependent HslUV protease ATP-binding subunit HslU